MRKNYVAYGSNLNLIQMGYRCPDAKLVAKGFLSNYELLFCGQNGNCYCTVKRHNGMSVPICIFSVSEKDIKSLDRYEGYPVHYRKVILKAKDIILTDCTKYISQPFIYIMNEDMGGIGAPSHRYFNTVLQGYRDCGLDKWFLYKAYDVSTLHLR